MRRIVSSAFLVLLLTGTFMLAFNVELVLAQAATTVYINSDGSVSPSNAPISSVDNITYTFTGNVSYPAYDGIVIERSNIVIDGAGYTVQGDQSGDGLSLTGISNVTIKNANIEGFENGIQLIDSNNGVISGNNATANSYAGIFVDGSSNNNVSGNNATANVYGIDVAHCSDNAVSANDATANSDVGIYIFGSTDNTVSGNYAKTNGDGIWLDLSASNVVSGNNATANTVGIYLYDSADNNVSGNDATTNGEGIYLSDSVYNTVSGNNATTNIEGIYLSDSSLGNTVSENTATENSADGIYLEGSSSNVVSSNNAIANINGIYLNSSSSNIISGNNASANSGVGIYLNFSSNNAVIGNTVTANSNYGILLLSSSDITVIGNTATTNYDGIRLSFSSNNNIVSGNNVTANSYAGIFLYASSDNTIYHNNFVGNAAQVSIDSTSVGNAWDNGYPSGGNFWSDYNGTDLYNGPYQNVTGSDGTGDTPYVIDANNTDHYPLMGMFSDFNVAAGVDVQVVSNSTVSDFQFNGTAILFNVSGANGTTGFCNVCIPTSMLNGTLSVFVNGTQVQYSLLPSSNSSISYLYFTYGHSTEQVMIMPEFPDFLILAMFMLAILLTITIFKKRHSRS